MKQENNAENPKKEMNFVVSSKKLVSSSNGLPLQTNLKTG
jgi:hypothetical protein